MSDKKAVSYPQILDKFGQDLTSLMNALRDDALKPAIMSDIIKVLSLLFWAQQCLTMMYNLNVANYEIMMGKIVALETKVAGQTEELNILKIKMEEMEKNR